MMRVSAVRVKSLRIYILGLILIQEHKKMENENYRPMNWYIN